MSELHIDIPASSELFAIERNFLKVSHQPPISKPVLFTLPTLDKQCGPESYEYTVDAIKNRVGSVVVSDMCFVLLPISDLDKENHKAADRGQKEPACVMHEPCEIERMFFAEVVCDII